MYRFIAHCASGWLLAALVALGTTAQAQTFEPLEHSGTLHRDFTRGISSRYRSKEAKERTGKRSSAEDRQERRTLNSYALQTAESLNRQHRSGTILTNDSVSQLVRRVGERLAAVNAERSGARDSIRFYVLASPAVNAFATTDHTVYVTMGLLARLESEAQLAFVLAHELGHVVLDHNLKLYLKADELQREAQRRGRRSKGEADPFAVNRYSRTNEQAADDYGYALYAALGYSGVEAVRAFELLSRSYLTFGEHRLTVADLTRFGLSPKPEWMLDSLVTPRINDGDDDGDDERVASTEEDGEKESADTDDTSDDTDDDTLDGEKDDNPSTHPAIEERLAEAQRRLGEHPGERFVVWTPADLAYIRRQARYETTDYHLRDGDYPEALADALYLLAQDAQPDTTYLRRVVTQALLGQTVVRQAYGDWLAERQEEFDEDDRALSNHVKARRARLGIEPAERPEDEWPGADQAYGELQRIYHLFAVADLQALATLVSAHAVAVEIADPTAPSSKVHTDRSLELIRATGLTQASQWRTVAPGVLAAGDAAGLRLESRFAKAKDFSDLQAYNKEDGERMKRIADGRLALGLDRVVVVTPRYSERLSADNLKAVEDTEQAHTETMQSTMKAAGVGGLIISDRLNARAADALNDVRLSKEWTGQFARLESLRLLPHNHDRLLALVEEQRAKALVYVFESHIGATGSQVMSLMVLPVTAYLSPFTTLVTLFRPSKGAAVTEVVVDPYERRFVYFRSTPYQTRQVAATREARQYQFFNAIKRKR